MMKMSGVPGGLLLLLLLLCSQCYGENEEGTGVELVDNTPQVVMNLLDRVKRWKPQDKTAVVGFSASLGIKGNLGPFHHDTILAYKGVLTNTGDAYNPYTGIFSAPMRGLYYFSFFGHNHSTKPMVLSLYKNGERKVSVYNHAAGSRGESASQGVNLLLEKGDHVYIKLWKHTWIHGNTDVNVSVFNGHLVVPM